VTGRICRRTAAALVAGGCAAVVALMPALPALAHGAPVQPISRTAACAPDNADAGTAACKAALKANGEPFGNFDNLRVPNVNGRDKQVIPDGKLCSGSLPEFKGLDLPRTDWPATKLTAGGTFTMQYRTTIPHEGSFRIYLSKQGYDPEKPLTWGELGTKPILTADNPPLRSGSYRMSGKLPADRTGRQMLYTVWQTTSTPDTYYSCSDVVLAAAPKPAGVKHTPSSPKPTASRSSQPAVAATPADGPSSPAAHESSITARPAADEQSLRGRQIIIGTLVVVVGVCGALALIRMRRSRIAQGIHRRPEIR
jgi:predicted carbohydrate-binding protein with CBM5 and CBM33 domain